MLAGQGRYELSRPTLLVANTAMGSGLAGAGVDLYDVLSNRQHHQLAAERERLDLLNRMFRHHLLNGMNAILASAEGLERRETDPAPELRAIRSRGDEVVGGDGTVREAASALLDSTDDPPPLLVVPAGRGNSLYRHLHCRVDWRRRGRGRPRVRGSAARRRALRG